jgi:hypothetical protein
MALGLTKIKEEVVGFHREVTVEVAFDSSYPTGGEDFDPAQFGIKNVHTVLADNYKGQNLCYDRANKKLQIFAGGSEAANGSDQTALDKARVVIRGH